MANISKVQLNNNLYNIISADDILLYQDGNTLYRDMGETESVDFTYLSGILSDVSSGEQKHFWVQNGGSAILPANLYWEGTEPITISYLSFEENAYKEYSYTASESNYKSTSIVGEQAAISFVKQWDASNQVFNDYLVLDIQPGQEYIQEMIDTAIASGDDAQIEDVWSKILAAVSSAAEPSTGRCYFRYTKIDQDESQSLADGIYAPVSLNQKITWERATDIMSSETSIYSDPFQLDGEWKRAKIQRASTQTSTDKLDLDIIIEDYTNTLQLYAEPADGTLYPDLDGNFVVTPPKTFTEIKSAIQSGTLVTLDIDLPSAIHFKGLKLHYLLDSDGLEYLVSESFSKDGTETILANMILLEDTSYQAFPVIGYVTNSTVYNATSAKNISNRIFYGMCGTAASTAAKVTSAVDSSFSLVKGAVVFISFSYTNTASSPTLNVNNTGAKSIRYYKNADTATTLFNSSVLKAGTNRFMYDGTYWILDVNTDRDVTQTNTTASNTYRVLLSNSANDTTETAGAGKSGNLTFNPSTGRLTVSGTISAGDNIFAGGDIHADGNVTSDASITAVDDVNAPVFYVGQEGTITGNQSVGFAIESLQGNDLSISAAQGQSVYISGDSTSITGNTSVTGTISATGNITSHGDTVLTVADGQLWSDYSGEDAEMLADNISISGYNGISLISSSGDVEISSTSLTFNSTPILPTVTLYFGQAGIYKDAARTNLYTTGDFASDIMDKNPILMVDGGGDGSIYPATYYYSKNGSSLGFAQITCLVNEANTLYIGQASYSTGTETFAITSSSINKIPAGGTTGQVLTKTSGSDYAVGWTTPSSGSTPITGTTNPTTSTVGTLGQMYLNTTTQIMYVCTYAGSTYSWKPITFESAESQVG